MISHEQNLIPNSGWTCSKSVFQFLVSAIRWMTYLVMTPKNKQQKITHTIQCKRVRDFAVQIDHFTNRLQIIWMHLLIAFGAIDFIPNIGKSIYNSITTSMWSGCNWNCVCVCVLYPRTIDEYDIPIIFLDAWPKYVDILVKLCKVFHILSSLRCIIESTATRKITSNVYIYIYIRRWWR